MNDTALLHMDDLQPGMGFKSAGHAIDEAQIKAFATQFDPQPFHLDAEAAKATLFGGLAASGWHTAAVTMRLPGPVNTTFRSANAVKTAPI